MIGESLSSRAEILKNIHIQSFNLGEMVIKSRYKNFQITQVFENGHLGQSNSIPKELMLENDFKIFLKLLKGPDIRCVFSCTTHLNVVKQESTQRY